MNPLIIKCEVHITLFGIPKSVNITFIHEPPALAGTDQGLSSQYRKLFDISSRSRNQSPPLPPYNGVCH